MFLVDSLQDSEVVGVSEDKCFIRAIVDPASWPLDTMSSAAIPAAKPTFNPDVPEFVPSKMGLNLSMILTVNLACHSILFLFFFRHFKVCEHITL